MHKLIIGAAFVCAAIIAQAATVTWGTGTAIKPNGSTSAVTGTLSIYVWLADNQSEYDKISLNSIWGTYGNENLSDMASSADASKGSLGGAAGGKASIEDVANGTTLYGIIITAYDSNKDGTVDMYAVNKATGSVNDIGGATSPNNLAKYIGGASTSGNVTWQSVPEPTSAMLLLLGMAGLALRRKQA